MSNVGEIERVTQNRIVKLFKNHLKYDYLGDLKDKENKNINPKLLKTFLQKQEYSEKIITRALRELDQAAAMGDGRSLYDANKTFIVSVDMVSKLRKELVNKIRLFGLLTGLSQKRIITRLLKKLL